MLVGHNKKEGLLKVSNMRRSGNSPRTFLRMLTEDYFDQRL